MCGSMLCFALGIVLFVLAEQCRQDPEQLKKRFITESGGAFSLFAPPFIHRPKEGRREVVENPTLRRLRLLEMYFQAIFLIIGSIWWMLK